MRARPSGRFTPSRSKRVSEARQTACTRSPSSSPVPDRANCRPSRDRKITAYRSARASGSPRFVTTARVICTSSITWGLRGLYGSRMVSFMPSFVPRGPPDGSGTGAGPKMGWWFVVSYVGRPTTG
jgi:hypothetical protein